MKIYTSNFASVRKLKPYQIPIATTGWGWPKYFFKGNNKNIYVNDKGVVIGFWDKKFSCSTMFEKLEEKCGQKPCPYLSKVPNCQFMIKYEEYLNSIEKTEFIKEFEELSKKVQKKLGFKEEPEIILLVFEAKSCTCAERPVIQKYFGITELEF